MPSGLVVDQVISSVLATVASTPALQQCAPPSIVMAAYQAATIGLPINALQLAYLVPFKGEVKFLPSYRGLVHLALATGYVADIYAEVVYANEDFKVAIGSNPHIHHSFDITKERRGDIIAAYAIARLTNGVLKQEVMTKNQIEKVRQSSSGAPNSKPWTQHTEEMYKKTVIKRLCKLLPMTGNFQNIQKALEVEANLDQYAEVTLTPPPRQPTNNTVTDIAPEPDGTPSESEVLISKIRDLQEAIREKDKKAEALPNLDDLTVVELEALYDRKLKHYELVK